jgi:hypothetical protein
MKFTVLLAASFIVLSSPLFGREPAMDAFQKLAPYTCGLCLAEVMSIEEYKPQGCGPNDCLSNVVKIKIEKSTGSVTNQPVIPIDCPSNNPGIGIKIDAPKISVQPIVGEKYWFVFRGYYGTYPSIFNIWPASGKDASKVCNYSAAWN